MLNKTRERSEIEGDRSVFTWLTLSHPVDCGKFESLFPSLLHESYIIIELVKFTRNHKLSRKLLFENSREMS